MNKLEIDVLNLENKLVRTRHDLNDILYRAQTENLSDDLLKMKLEKIEDDIAFLNDQIASIKTSKSFSFSDVSSPAETLINRESTESEKNMTLMSESESQTDTNEILVSEPELQHDANDVPASKTELQINTNNRNVYRYKNTYNANNQVPPVINNNCYTYKANNLKTERKDYEKIIGKSWMGIVASILVFFSIIVFSKFVSEYISDFVKMAAMFAGSIALTGFGYYKVIRNPENKFYISLCGCGIGAIFISLLVSNMYFKAIDDIVLYALLLIWAILVRIFACNKSIVFKIIGECGIAISVIFGSILCGKTNDDRMFLMLAVYTIIAILVFSYDYLNKRISDNLLISCFGFFNLIILCIAGLFFDDSVLLTVTLLLVGAFEIGLCIIALLKEDASDTEIIVVEVLSYVTTFLICLKLVVNTAIPMIVVTCIVFAVNEIRNTGNQIARNVVQGILIVAIIYFAHSIEFIDSFVGLGIFAVPLLVIGYLRNNYLYKYAGLAMMFLLCVNDSLLESVTILWSVLFVVALFILNLLKKEQYNCIFKVVTYLWFIVTSFINYSHIVDKVFDSSIIFFTDSYIYLLIYGIFIGILNILAWRSELRYDRFTKKEEKLTDIVLKCVHVAMMYIALVVIGEHDTILVQVLAILWALVLFMINSKEIINKYNNWYGGIYTGLKFTVLLGTILYSFDAINLIVSISLFGLSIICIAVGFKFYFKALRIYGLILANITVLKLVFYDISFDGLGSLALCLFSSGVLCFAISMIYNNIDKRLNRTNTSGFAASESNIYNDEDLISNVLDDTKLDTPSVDSQNNQINN